MTGEAFAELCVILANKPPGSANKWNAGLMKVYQVSLRHVPDDLAGPLVEAICDRCRFRPEPAEIIELAGEIRGGGAARAHEILAEIKRLKSRYGPHGVYHAVIGPHQARYTLGAPPELSAEARATVEPWGGWVGYCQDPSPSGVLTGQTLKVAQAVIDDAPSETMRRLQAEYQAARRALPAPALEYDDTPEPLPTEGDAGALLEKIGARLPRLTQGKAK